ncbi:PREDICTED: uncharacterized protein LOC105455077 isoform X2 [Wasmannia auropunctata]|uniref:uncharacterized protein LOC105455077 isoform X2 n=1 Tax=Wasmannia auropunctata TaxID=64793 RepID=UPI0005F0115A|nr:PREDICTED: uncharacterized protein LOC105455077 isoform X2 [Wasmannia auropunctata]
MNENKRGPYKQYLKSDDSRDEIPTSTVISRKKRREELNHRRAKPSRPPHNDENSERLLDNHENNDHNDCESEKERDSTMMGNNDNLRDVENICDSNLSQESVNDDQEHSANDSASSEDVGDDDDSNIIDEDRSSIISDSYNGADNLESSDDASEENAQRDDMDESEDDEINHYPNDQVWRHLIYEDCDLTKEENVLIMMSMALRHNFTDEALQSLIQTIDCHLPHRCHGSKYLFLKAFPKNNYRVYYYCSQCLFVLNIDHNCITVRCDNCLKHYKLSELKKDQAFFIYIPLKEQLIELVNSEIYAQFRQESDDSDIINGTLYHNLKRKNVIGKNDITIQWNTDGVQLFNSSLTSLWPILVSINELPYRIRKQQILLTGLWFNSRKPPMNIFLKPFVDELIELHNIGFESTTLTNNKKIRIKVHTLVAPVDSVARPAIQCMKQFNGIYGCSYCYHKGKQICTGQNGRKRIYCGNISTLRKKSHYEYQSEKTLRKNKPVKGVKGPSVVALIPLFDVISSFPPEYMHSVAEGVIKQFVIAWFDPRNRDKDWCLTKHKSCFDKRLLSMKPTHEITRTPRSITQRKLWKASEYKNFALYYSIVCLEGLMPKKYVKHWLLFVYSMHVFLSMRMRSNEFIMATLTLRKFVFDIEKLYDKTFMNYNVHMMLHIPEAVKKFGVLWAWSTFPFENFNHTIQSLFKGTQCIPEQICKFYSRIRYIKQSSTFNKPNCSVKGKAVFDSLMKQCRIQRCIEYENHLTAFGPSKKIDFSLIEKITIEEFLGDSVKNKALTFQRFIYKNVLYHGFDYARLIKRRNNTVLTQSGSLLVIQYLCIAEKATGEKKQLLICKELRVLKQEVLCKNKNVSSNNFSYVVEEMDNIRCSLLHMIKNKCINIPVFSSNNDNSNNNKRCIIPLVNSVETD